MGKIFVARKFIRLAKSIIAEEYDYICDPDHKREPGGDHVKDGKWLEG